MAVTTEDGQPVVAVIEPTPEAEPAPVVEVVPEERAPAGVEPAEPAEPAPAAEDVPREQPVPEEPVVVEAVEVVEVVEVAPVPVAEPVEPPADVVVVPVAEPVAEPAVEPAVLVGRQPTRRASAFTTITGRTLMPTDTSSRRASKASLPSTVAASPFDDPNHGEPVPDPDQPGTPPAAAAKPVAPSRGKRARAKVRDAFLAAPMLDMMLGREIGGVVKPLLRAAAQSG